ASIDEYTFGASMMGRAVFTAPFVGLILGDLESGINIGATLESMFMGSIMEGSATPPEVYASSVLRTAIAIQSGQAVG
ncbi:PTS sugar transporter subunit IIC, partial [Enterococcus faecium]|uniref:PTS sugar transporter subunit IIC n=1 Tax=Enterococcus faecium TaxID=1352 RepID=UPI003CC68F2D